MLLLHYGGYSRCIYTLHYLIWKNMDRTCAGQIYSSPSKFRDCTLSARFDMQSHIQEISNRFQQSVSLSMNNLLSVNTRSMSA